MRVQSAIRIGECIIVYSKNIMGRNGPKYTIGNGKKKQSAMSVAKRAMYGVNKMKRNQELKFIDTSNTVSINSTGTVTPLTLSAQGNTTTQRVGLNISLKSLHFRIAVNLNASATFSNLRWILFRAKQTDGVVPSVNDVLQSVQYDSPADNTNRADYWFIKEGIIALDAAHVLVGRKYFRKLNIKVQYSGSTAVEASIKSNAIYLLLLSDEGTNTPAVDYYSRIRFTDD